MLGFLCTTSRNSVGDFGQSWCSFRCCYYTYIFII